jgi:hypothetical protein
MNQLIVHVNNSDTKKDPDELDIYSVNSNTKNKAMVTIKEEARIKKYHQKFAKQDQNLLGAFIRLIDKNFFSIIISCILDTLEKFTDLVKAGRISEKWLLDCSVE